MSHQKDKIYLSGAIQFAQDASSWRSNFIKRLSKYYDFFNPMDKLLPQKIYDMPDSYEKYNWVFKNIVMKDLAGLDTCDYMFCKLDHASFKGSGTSSEITLASVLDMPIMYVLDNIKFKDIPMWTRACLVNADNLGNMEKAIKFLTKLTK